MVVDDNPDAAESLSLLLETEGFETAVAHSGKDAIALAVRFNPATVLLDLNMPEMDGFETAQRLAQRSPVCLIALSADDTPRTLRRIREYPFHDHLTKPSSLDEIVAALERCPPLH